MLCQADCIDNKYSAYSVDYSQEYTGHCIKVLGDVQLKNALSYWDLIQL